VGRALDTNFQDWENVVATRRREADTNYLENNNVTITVDPLQVNLSQELTDSDHTISTR